jgi:hypothetical protein
MAAPSSWASSTNGNPASSSGTTSVRRWMPEVMFKGELAGEE